VIFTRSATCNRPGKAADNVLNRAKGLIVAAVVVLLTLAFATPGLAANTGTVVVSHSTAALGKTVSTTIHVTLPLAQDPPAAINIYAPTGYAANLSAFGGIGNVEATVFSFDNNLTLPLTGSVSTDNPALYAAGSLLCAGTPSSAAVWLLNLGVAGQTVVVPVFVNATVGAEQLLGAYKLSICLQPPDVPVGTPGRATIGVQLLDAKFTVNGIFTTPSTSGLIRWETLVTPYAPRTGQVNHAGTFELRSLIGLPVRVTLSTRYKERTKTYKVSGKVTVNGAPFQGEVALLNGTKKPSLMKVATLTTSSSGSFAKSGRQKPNKTSYFKVTVAASERDATSTGCQQPLPATVAPAGCVSATLAGPKGSSPVVRLKT
jgi:hypothetical protein